MPQWLGPVADGGHRRGRGTVLVVTGTALVFPAIWYYGRLDGLPPEPAVAADSKPPACADGV